MGIERQLNILLALEKLDALYFYFIDQNLDLNEISADEKNRIEDFVTVLRILRDENSSRNTLRQHCVTSEESREFVTHHFDFYLFTVTLPRISRHYYDLRQELIGLPLPLEYLREAATILVEAIQKSSETKEDEFGAGFARYLNTLLGSDAEQESSELESSL